MPKSLFQVQQEFEDFKRRNPNDPSTIESYAKGMDALEGVPERAPAYDPRWYNKVNAFIDKGFEATGAPYIAGEVGETVGRIVDANLGTGVAPTLRSVGESTPRMISEGLATLPAGGAGAWGRGLGILGKVLGYGSAGVRGYAETDSPAGAVISAGSLALGNKLLLPKEMGGVDVGGRVRTGLQDLLAPKLEGTALQAASTAEKFVPALAGVGADVGTATALNEATRQANLTVMPDEMRAPGDRNPFTQENIAGNLAGAAFFTPQIVSALRNRPRVSIGQARQLHDFLTKNEQALADLRGEQPLPQTDGVPATAGEVDTNMRDRHEALYGIIRSSLDAAGEFDKIGSVEDASRARMNALEAIDEAASGRFSPMPPDLIAKIKVSVDNEARMQPPSDPAKFEGFVNEVRGIVDMMNEGKLSYADELAQREEVLNRNDKKAVAAHEAWKQSMLENKGKSWHPEARSSEVVDRLWKSGNLQPLTPEWLSQEFNATFDDSGNPTFSTRVVAQKVANYALDNLDAALKQEQATRKAVTETSQAVRKYNDIDLQFAEALAKLPQDVRDAVVRRSVEIRRYGNYTPDQAERMGVTEGTRTKVTGEVTSPYLPWQKAVIRAMKSYDPETRTALLRMRGKGFQRTTLDTLVRKDGSKYVWEPNEQTVAPALGGKSSTKGAMTDGGIGKRFETNIEGLPTKEGQDAVGALDEEEFKAALAQTSQEPNLAGDFGTIHFEGEAAPAIDLADEAGASESALGDRMSGASGRINKSLDALSDAQLWALAKSEFRSNFKNVDDPRAQNLRLAVRAAMESFRRTGDAPVGPNAKAFYDAEIKRGLKPTQGKSEKWNVRRFLADYFQTKFPVEGGEGKLPPHEERLARIVKKLLDPQTVERAKTGIKASTDAGDRPLIRFSAPVRLTDWMNGKYRLAVTPDAQGRIPGKSIETVLTKLGISKDEMALYRAAGIQDLINQPQVSVEKLVGWMEQNTPKVEVKKLEVGGGTDPAVGEAQHYLESLGFSVERGMDGEIEVRHPHAYGFGRIVAADAKIIEDYGNRTAAAIDKLLRSEYRASADAATGRYGVEPKDLKDMPGAVDILVRVPVPKYANAREAWNAGDKVSKIGDAREATGQPLYRGPHFGDSDVNVLASVRGYIETLPSGEKVFHVFEVQSDWGQKSAKVKEATKGVSVAERLVPKYDTHGNKASDTTWFVVKDGIAVGEGFATKKLAEDHIKYRITGESVKDHPLLAVYEQLALKSAIEHARSLGIKKVAISDAETAMMTEGHDRAVPTDNPIPFSEAVARDLQRTVGLDEDLITDYRRRGVIDFDATPEDVSKIDEVLQRHGITNRRPSQEPGMRAAYDDRLPRTMEKLTGEKGVPVDFGEHKATSGAGDVMIGGTLTPEERNRNGSPVFNNKTSVTGRLYDITRAPDQFAAFGYGKPMVDEAGNVITDGSQGTIVNEPRAGAFIGDVERTFRAWVDKHLGRAGYSGSSKEFAVEVATALARQMPNLDFFRIVGSEYGLAGTGESTGQTVSPRGKLGLNMDRVVPKGEEYRALQQVLQTLAHEMTHMDGFIRDGLVPRPDAYSDERTRLVNNLDHLAKNLNDDERLSILTVLNESIPEQFRSKIRQADGRLYGTSNPDEFVAEVVSKTIMMLANDTAAGRAAAKEALDYGPAEVREIARDGFRTVRDTMLAMREALTKGKYMTGATDPVILGKGFEALVDTATVMTDFKQADVALALGRQAIANLDTGGGSRPPARMTDAIWFRGQRQLAKAMADAPVPTQTTIDAINEVQDRVFSAKAYNEKYTPNAFARWLYPFTNLMTAMERQGVTLARPVLENVMSLEPGISRIYSSFLGDFLKKQPDGSYKLDDAHPLVELVSEQKAGPWRDAVNAISAWQQENNSKPMFVRDEKGVITVNPDPKLKAQAAWDRIRHRVPAEQQQYVMGASVAFDAANSRAASTLVYHLQQSNVASVATYLMAANKKMSYDQAQAIAQKVHDAYLSGNVRSLAGTAPQEQLNALHKLLVGNVTKEAPLGDGLLAKFVEVKNMLEARQGFRSESLPHDWIIKYEENGKIRFDSRPTEAQARYLANRITARGGRIHGEILNRRDMRAPTDFDHPDTILAKVAETEDFVWKNFVADMEQTHGAEIAQSLTDGYTPVAQSIKEFGTQGLNKFLRQRRSLVDREKFDYIDGQFAYMQRLASSIAIRSAQQQIRLILNDPRARFMPTFRKLVQEHIAEMMTPLSDSARQMKAFTTTYFLGANLASTAVNGTQSITTLVPWLIAGIDSRHPTKGGPAKAWKDMGLAMGDAVSFTIGDSWKQTARTAITKDPRTRTLEESLAAAYHTHVENGGVQQTVIDDLVYGRDQRMLMNAKFGHGDYGPTPVTTMIGNGVYMASQAMLTLYKWVERFNARTAFLAGARQAYELGLRGDELYQYSAKMQSLATFGGGRSNAPGLVPKLSTQYTRSAVGLVNSLQQYGYGMVATYGQLMKDSIGKSKGLNALQVRQAQKAFGTMLMTQVAVAGALGLPFVGAALTLLEKVFGIPATQAIRQGLASLSDDEETGAVIAETGLNGFANQALGLDVSSRLGTSNLLGTSSYRGFDLRDMVGPAGSIIGNAAEALNLFGQQKPMEAMHKLVPAAFKNVVELSNTKAKYGDFGLRDSGGALLYTPTDSQRLGYALGFRPRELSQKRAMQSMLLRADERTSARRDRELDGAAQSLLMGDPSQAQRLAQDARAADPTIDTRDILRQVMDRGVAAQTPKDLLATGSRWNEAERRGIASTFGEGVNTRQSEVDAQNLRLQLAGVLGDPRLAPTADSYKRAVVIDHLVKTRGLTRSEATRLAEFLGL